jgi:hypothetical protein
LVIAEFCSWGTDPLPAIEDIRKKLIEETEQVHLKEDQAKEYWDRIAEATILLCQFLPGDQNVIYEDILEQYTFAWTMIGSEGQRQAEIENLEFIEDALEMGGDKAMETLALVRRLKIALEALV